MALTKLNTGNNPALDISNKIKEITQNVKSLRHGAFVDSQSIFWIFAAVAEQVSRIMAPEEESAKPFYSLSN